MGRGPVTVAVADVMTFTLPMMLARLWSERWQRSQQDMPVLSWPAGDARDPGDRWILLGLFIPQHVMLWDNFQFWYHLTFLPHCASDVRRRKHASGWRPLEYLEAASDAVKMGIKPRS